MGTGGRGTLVDVSQKSMVPRVGTGTHKSVRNGAAPSDSGLV